MKQWVILAGVFIGAITAQARAEPWCGSSTPPELCQHRDMGGTVASPSPSVMSPFNGQDAEKAAREECSKQADSKGLHGVERKTFRAGCKAAFQNPPPSAADVSQLKPVSPPPTSTIARGRRRNAIAPLAIETESGTNYLIKLVKAGNKKDFILIFVKGGETYSTKVPLGTYNIREAAGLSWYGLKDFFGPSTQFFRMRNKNGRQANFSFNRQGNMYHGMKISLKKVAEGNMEEEAISRDEF
jgi:hypothetical protein